MYRKRIFKKKRRYKFFRLLLIFSFSISVFFLYYLFFYNTRYFSIPSFDKDYYIVPKDKGGQKIINQDKKSLHLSYKNKLKTNLVNNPNLIFSIQLLTDEDHSVILSKRSDLINQIDNIFKSQDLYVAVLNSYIGDEYMLLYKNFYSRNEAIKYCEDYLFFLNKCLIVNVRNLN